MKLARILGIPIKINDYFILLIIAYTFLGVLPNIVIIFFTVLIHELAHSIESLRKGIKVKEIELFPFGGVARLEYIDVNSNNEFTIAVAGPLINFIIAGIGFILLHYKGINYWLLFLIRTNLVIGLFNLIPALPLDGGRMYRSIKSTKYGVKNATHKASKNGKIFSVILFFLGSLGVYFKINDISMPILAIFLFISANSQDKTASYQFIRFLSRKKEQYNNSELMETENYVLKKDYVIEDLISYLKPGKYSFFFIINDNGKIIKTLSEEQIINAYFKYGSKKEINYL